MKTSGRQRNIAVLLWLSLTGKQQTVITILSCLVSVTGWVMRNISYKCKYSPQFSQISVLWYYILRIVQHKPAVINKLPPYNFLLIPKRFSGFRQFSSIVNPYLLHTLRSGFDILSEIDCLSIWLIIGCLIFSYVEPVPVPVSLPQCQSLFSFTLYFNRTSNASEEEVCIRRSFLSFDFLQK